VITTYEVDASIYTGLTHEVVKKIVKHDGYNVTTNKELLEMINAKTCHRCGKELGEVKYINDWAFCSSACIKEAYKKTF